MSMPIRPGGRFGSAPGRSSAGAPPTRMAASQASTPRAANWTDTSIILDEALITFFKTEKESDPRASVAELIRRARERGLLHGPIDRTTVWRACRRMGLPTRPCPTKHEGDMRRWTYSDYVQQHIVRMTSAVASRDSGWAGPFTIHRGP